MLGRWAPRLHSFWSMALLYLLYKLLEWGFTGRLLVMSEPWLYSIVYLPHLGDVLFSVSCVYYFVTLFVVKPWGILPLNLPGGSTLQRARFCVLNVMCSTNESLLDTRRRHQHYHSYHREHISRRLGDDQPRRRCSSWSTLLTSQYACHEP